MNVLIVQDGIPIYRIGFYRELLRDRRFKLLSPGNDFSTESPIYLKFIDGLFFLAPKYNDLKDFDLVVVNGKYKNLGLFYLKLMSWILGFKLVYWGHYFTSKRSGLLKNVRLIFLKFFDAHFFYVQEEVRQAIQEGILKSYSLENACHNSPSVNFVYRSWHPNKDVKFLFIGRLTDKVDHSRMFSIVERIPGCMLGIIGADGSGFVSHENIKFYGDVREESRLIEISKEYDFGVYFGSIGLSLLTYCYLGLPVILDGVAWHMPEFDYYRRHNIGISFKTIDEIGEIISKMSAIEYHDYVQNCLSCANEITLKNMSKNFVNSSERLYCDA